MEDQGRVDITLSSKTIFWCEDLGVSQHDLDLFKTSDYLANKVLTPIKIWIAENCKHDTRIYHAGVWFMNEKEALLFKLFFAGQLDEELIRKL
jgi:hypothetical protein